MDFRNSPGELNSLNPVTSQLKMSCAKTVLESQGLRNLPISFLLEMSHAI